MHISELFRFYVFAQKSVNQSTLIEPQLTRPPHSDTKAQGADIPFGAVLLALICFMMVWAIVVFIVSSALKATQEKNEIVSIKSSQQYPCRNCRFFSDNHYLKCAVHPSLALTKEALNCSDYWSK